MGELLDAALERAFGSGSETIRYIQIGGNDGVHEDPLYAHHVAGKFNFDWGQIYEPVPEYFELLVQNMKPFPYVHCHEQAVDNRSEPGTRTFNYVSPHDVRDHDLPPSSKGIGSFTRDRNALGGIGYSEAKFKRIESYIRTIDVRTIPAAEVVSRFSDTNLLVTDCEGHDIDIISAILDSEAFRPRIIQFEYLGRFEDLLNATLGRLRDRGYEIARPGKDVICQLA